MSQSGSIQNAVLSEKQLWISCVQEIQSSNQGPALLPMKTWLVLQVLQFSYFCETITKSQTSQIQTTKNISFYNNDKVTVFFIFEHYYFHFFFLFWKNYSLNSQLIQRAALDEPNKCYPSFLLENWITLKIKGDIGVRVLLAICACPLCQ